MTDTGPREEIVKKYPDLFPEDFWGLEIGEGWLATFDEMCSFLSRITKVYEVRITAAQVKEKFGELRFYYDVEYKEDEGCRDWKREQVSHAVSAYCVLFDRICDVCGKEGKLGSNGRWMSVRCDEHK